jgi:hypothetical protein
LKAGERQPAVDPWEDRDARSGRPLVHQEKSAGFWGSVTSKVSLSDPDGNDPLAKREWKADQGWQMPVLGMVSFFGQLGAASDEAAMREMKLAGRTGLAVKLTMAPGAEVQFRGGPGVTYVDPLRPEHVQEKPDLLLEVQCRWPLLGRVGLEYQGTAVPGLTPQDRNQMTQDVGLACPLGQVGKLRLGAKRRWDNFLDPRPGSESKELYLGLQLGGK